MGLEINYSDGQTPINEEEKEGLKIKSITSQRELDEFEQLNIEKAVEWTINNKFSAERILTEKFIKEVHEKMYGEVWKWAGNFRKSNKNIGIHWTLIAVELKKLLDDTNYWIQNKTFEPEHIAITFKHRIVAIHCFPNRNGRHSRMLADIIMESVFQKEIFTWQHSNMIKANETRKKYILALKQADMGNIGPLIEFAKG